MVAIVLKKKQRSTEDLKLTHVFRKETDSQYSDCTQNLYWNKWM